MRLLTLFLIYSVNTCTPVFAEAPAEYPRIAERKIAMELLARVEASQPNVKIDDLGSRPVKEQLFLQYFEREIYPQIFILQKLNSVAAISQVSLDRALYNDTNEKNTWVEKVKNTNIEVSRIVSDDAWKKKIREWKRLAEDLEGELPTLAREMVEIDDLKGFTSEQMPLVERLTDLETKISLAANESSVTGADLAEYAKTIDQIEKDYRANKISFSEATAKVDAIWPKGSHAKGHDVSTRAYDMFNEVAVLRTKLAQSKGYRTWAEFQLSDKKYTHAPGLRTPDDHIQFMSSVLENTREQAEAYLNKLKTDNPGLEIDNRNSFLLAPESDTLVSDYFPVENVNEFWKKTMTESGFNPEVFNVINLDSFPRENKQTHAYMWNVVNPYPKVIHVKAGELKIDIPPAGQENWNSAMINIVQNARTDGIDAYETVFHEGGHALDFAHRLAPFERDEAYAYSETASMTMERFFDDIQFLLAKGKTKEGKSLEKSIADTYLTNKKLIAALGNRGQVFNALFDILIWNETYTENGPKLVDRMRDIFDQQYDKYFPGVRVYPEGVRAGSRMFSTGHFYSGNVRYYGYIYADMAAQMTANFLWDHFEQTKGERTLLNQSEIANILVPGQYQRGFSLLFPEATEKLTQKKFAPNELAENINSAIKKALGSDICNFFLAQ